MRKNWKKLLSLVLALAMVLNMNVAAFADEVAPVADPAIEEEAPAADPAPAAEEPAAAVEEPAEAEAPAEASEEPAAAEPEAAAPVEAETENEDAAEGNESAPNTVINSGTTVSGVTITFEKHGSVISDNKGNLTIKKNAIVGLAGTADADITVTVEDGAEVYVGAALTPTDNDTDRDSIAPHNSADLKKVTFAGSGTLYFVKKNDVSVNATNTVDVSRIDGNLVISANEYRFYTNTDGDGYDVKSFTGLSGKLQIFDMTYTNFKAGASPYYIADSVSAADCSMSVNSGIGIYKNGKFAPDSTAVSGASIGEGKDFNFGETIFYHSGTDYYYTKVSAKNDTPDSSKVVGAPNDLMESSWRPDGIDLEEAVAGALTYNGGTNTFDAISDDDVEFTIVPKGGAAPDQIKSVWAKYNYDQGDHTTFNTLADGKTISANTDYDLYARNVSGTKPDPKLNGKFYSDVVKIGSFTTKETPTEITIPSAKTITYQGDATDQEAKANNPFLNGFNVTFKDKDGKDTKKLTIGTDRWGDGYYPYGNGDEKFVGLAVKIDGSTVGVLKNYIVLSANGLSADAVAKMDQPAIASASKKTLNGMKDLQDDEEEGRKNIKYLSANTYYVRSFFEAYKDTEYTDEYHHGVGDTDLPYQTASSNVMTLTVEKAKLTIVPDYKGSATDKYGKNSGYRAFSDDPELTTTSGNKFTGWIYAFDPDKASGEGLKYQRVSNGTRDEDGSDYFDSVEYDFEDPDLTYNVFTTGTLKLDDGSTKKAVNIGTSTPLSAGASGNQVYKLSVSEGSLTWQGKVSENFVITYPEYTITVAPRTAGNTYTYNHVGFKGYSYYGSPLATVKRRVYQAYTETVSGSGKVYNDTYTLGDELGVTYIPGDVYRDAACTQKISSDEIMADIPAGETVYVSINEVMAVSDNWTRKEDYYKYENTVAVVKIEPRPIDVYSHGYPYRGEAYDGTMDSSETYGDVREHDAITNYGGLTDGFGSYELYLGYDDYLDSKKAYFQGADLLENNEVKALNAALVDTTETTYGWDEYGDYVDTPVKVYLDLKKGLEDAGSALKAGTLKGNFYINTAVGYVSVLPKYTVAYMLQYEDPRNDNGKNADKLVALEEHKWTKDQMKQAVVDNEEPKYDANHKINPAANAEVKAWTKGTSILNKEDGDEISKWNVYDVNGNNVGGIDDYTGTLINIYAQDVFVNAVVSATVGSNIKIESIDPVFYTGLGHIAKNETATWKNEEYNLAKTKSNQVNDLKLTVKTSGGTDLDIGKDYTVTYKNNINASVYFEDNGKTSLADKVKPVFAKKSKKPQVVIKGAGRYKGKFSATIYFDIYPVNIAGGGVADYIRHIDDYYGNEGLYRTVNGVKSSYFAKSGKPAKVSYKVNNVHAPSKVTLDEAPGTTPNYVFGPDWEKGKIVTLKKGKDYAEKYEKFDTAKDKNNENMGWVPVTAKQLLPVESNTSDAGTQYRLTVNGKGNYCGVEYAYFYVYNEGASADISKLKITTPKTLQWENLMLNGDNTIRDEVDLNKLGIKVESKQKSTYKAGKGGKQVTFTDTAWTYDIYKVDKKGKVEKQVVQDGALQGNFNDAGLYKLVIRPKGTLREEVRVYNKKDEIDSKKSTRKRFRGTIEKNFTIKGITLKKGDFKLAWTSKKWNGKNDAQSLSFKKAVPQTLTKGKLNQVYVDKYLKDYYHETWEPFWNATDKRFEAYVRDFCLEYDATPAEAVQYIIGNKAGYALGDVYYEDNGLAWANPKQLDVYRYTFEAAGNNKDVGTYTIYVPTDGVFGTDGLKITYKRTGTATKVLSIENAK